MATNTEYLTSIYAAATRLSGTSYEDDLADVLRRCDEEAWSLVEGLGTDLDD